jgi:hypothetical protein
MAHLHELPKRFRKRIHESGGEIPSVAVNGLTATERERDRGVHSAILIQRRRTASVKGGRTAVQRIQREGGEDLFVDMNYENELGYIRIPTEPVCHEHGTEGAWLRNREKSSIVSATWDVSHLSDGVS